MISYNFYFQNNVFIGPKLIVDVSAVSSVFRDKKEYSNFLKIYLKNVNLRQFFLLRKYKISKKKNFL